MLKKLLNLMLLLVMTTPASAKWEMSEFMISREKMHETISKEIAETYKMNFSVHYSDTIPRLALFVTSLSHCLFDILSRWQSGEWKVEIPVIISNHDKLRNL